MHLRGEPKTMQDRPVYVDVVDEVRGFLTDRMRKAVEGGVATEAIAVDPGIGFGKDLDHNLDLLRHLDQQRGPLLGLRSRLAAHGAEARRRRRGPRIAAPGLRHFPGVIRAPIPHCPSETRGAVYGH